MRRLDVLVVEDGAGWRKHIEHVLTELGHDVAVVPNAVVAARRVLERAPDVLILDGNLPLGFTHQLLSWMRMSKNEHVPILVSEDPVGSIRLAVALSLGASGVVAKGATLERWYVALRDAVAGEGAWDVAATIETPSLS